MQKPQNLQNDFEENPMTLLNYAFNQSPGTKWLQEGSESDKFNNIPKAGDEASSNYVQSRPKSPAAAALGSCMTCKKRCLSNALKGTDGNTVRGWGAGVGVRKQNLETNDSKNDSEDSYFWIWRNFREVNRFTLLLFSFLCMHTGVCDKNPFWSV